MVMPLPGPDPAPGAAAQRQRVRFARDIGDEAGLAWAHEPRRKRSRFTVGTAAVLAGFAVVGALPMLFSDSDGQLVPATCDRPAVAVGRSPVEAGSKFAWQVAGPEQGPYVVTMGAGAVTGPPSGRVTVDTGRVLAGPTALAGCRSAQTVTDGPATAGSAEITLFRRTASGWERVAIALLEVS